MLELRGDEVFANVFGNISDCGIGHECNPLQAAMVIACVMSIVPPSETETVSATIEALT